MKKLEIKKPCSADWSKMTGTEKKRFCASCQHDVEDFTDKTVEEIILHLGNKKERTCGRLTKSQLNPVRKIAAAVMIGGMLAGACSPKLNEEASCDKHPVSSKVEMNNSENKEVVLTVNGKVKVAFNGIVLLEDGEEAIGASVVLKLSEPKRKRNSLKKGTASEFDGTFIIETEVDTETDNNNDLSNPFS